MLDLLRHILGFCPDIACHPNLWYFIATGMLWPVAKLIKRKP